MSFWFSIGQLLTGRVFLEAGAQTGRGWLEMFPARVGQSVCCEEKIFAPCICRAERLIQTSLWLLFSSLVRHFKVVSSNLYVWSETEVL